MAQVGDPPFNTSIQIERVEVPTPHAYIDRGNETIIEWGTPDSLFYSLDRVFGPFDLDPAANCGQHGLPQLIVPGVQNNYYCLGCGYDALKIDWGASNDKAFVNPPYDKQLPEWVAKAENEVNQGNIALVAMLLPVRTGRKWWKVMTQAADHIIWLPGRLKFKGADNSAPFDSCVVLWWNL